jgi:exopolysaccharide biosynthesis polyprenyl glycosylphosphotransferase
MSLYSEAEELATGGRVIALRNGSGATRSGSASGATAPLLIDLRAEAPGEDPVLLHEPRTAVPQQERRAVGRVLLMLGHLLDGIALAIPLVLSGLVLNEPIQIKVILLFALVGTLLLWPTARRGRLVVVPSEGLLGVIGRVGLTPVITLTIISLVRMEEGRSINVLVIVQIVIATIPLILLGRLITFRLVGLARSRGFDLEDTLIIGTGPVGIEVAEALDENSEFGLVPCGFVDRYDDGAPLPVVGRPEHLPEILALTGVRHVILAFGAADDPELVSIVRRCHDHSVQFYAVPRLFELGVSAEDVGHEISGLPLVPVRRPGATASMWPAKRAMDVITASLLLVLTAPVMIACALAVKLTSSGPVFFRQVRIGVGGRPFEILKFRTMTVNDDSATQWSVHEDERVTRVGRFLRPTHLDELPQLINVLRGEMSLVGPRPERPHFVEQFEAEIDGYQFRHRVPVGMTGWAQVNGYWGDTSIETRVRLDNRYIENWSLWRDLVIGLRTIPTLLGKRR